MFCGPFASRGFLFNKVSQYFSENGAMMDKIVFFVFGGDFLTSRTRLTGRTFLGVGIKKDPTLVVESIFVGVDGFFLRYAAKALAR